jgi:beta-lactam-binding protein with PASTA domain
MTARRRTRTRYEAPPETTPVEVERLSPFDRSFRTSGSIASPGPEAAVVPKAQIVWERAPEVVVAPPEPKAQPEAPAGPRRRVTGFFFILALALVAFVTGLLVFNSLVMPRLIHGIGHIQVPDVRSLSLDQAEQALQPLNLQLSRAGERFDPSVPRGFILSQDPAPGTTVRGHKRISVVVSLGEEFSSVPALFGESQRSAEQLLRSAGLRLGAFSRAPSEDVGEGLVVGSDPGPESVLPQGSPVSLLVSSGAGVESFVMPDLRGREIGGIRRQLESLGLTVRTPPGTPAVGIVVSQRPATGSRITRETEIFLQASGRVIR